MSFFVIKINKLNKYKMTDNIKKKKVELSPNARLIVEKRYLRKDENEKVIEEPVDMFRRVAKNIASADEKYGASTEELKKTEDEFFEIMSNLEFLSGMALRNAGRAMQQLSACYVLPLEDSMESIFTTLKNAAFLHKTGAGVGYNFSKLRQKGGVINTTGGRSSGPISFMKLYNYSTETVVNNATFRRGGNMGILRVDHPDILEFITVKSKEKELNNFNISVSITDEFMKAVKEGTDYAVVNPKTQEEVRRLDAREVFDLIVKTSWQSAEPGLLFIDRVNEFNTVLKVGEIEATNLCGEQPLLPYEACNLGSIVLSKMLKNCEGDKMEIDYDKIKATIKLAVHFLDNSVDINAYPLPEIEEINLANRKIGLGIMGFASMLYYLGIPYNSEEAVSLSKKLMEFIQKSAREASSDIAKKRGNFPNYERSTFPEMGYTHMRNATVTTIAPNGATSIIADTSSGVEPVFALVYTRKDIQGIENNTLFEGNPVFEEIAKDNWFYSQELMEKISKGGSVQGVDEVPEKYKKIFVTSHDVSPEWHVKIQAAFQKYTDNAVSKTVNMSHDATEEDVRKVFMMAFESGCKGVTVYRDRCRDKQVLNINS